MIPIPILLAIQALGVLALVGAIANEMYESLVVDGYTNVFDLTWADVLDILVVVCCVVGFVGWGTVWV